MSLRLFGRGRHVKSFMMLWAALWLPPRPPSRKGRKQKEISSLMLDGTWLTWSCHGPILLRPCHGRLFLALVELPCHGHFGLGFLALPWAWLKRVMPYQRAVSRCLDCLTSRMHHLRAWLKRMSGCPSPIYRFKCVYIYLCLMTKCDLF